MLVGEDLLVPRAEVTQLFVVYAFYVSMKIRPTPAGNVTIGSWAIIAK